MRKIQVDLRFPLFNSIESVLSSAIFCIPNVKDSEYNNSLIVKDRKVVTKINNTGSILGSLSNGMPIVLRVSLKSRISKEQITVSLVTMDGRNSKIIGRHDSFIPVRTDPVIGSMTAISPAG